MDRMLVNRLRRRILVALACGTACTGRDLQESGAADEDTGDADGTTAGGSTTPTPPTDDGGTAPGTTMPADESEVDDGEVDESDVDDGEDDDSDDDAGVHFDLGTLPDAGVIPPPPPFLDCDDPPPLAPDGACTVDEHDEYADVTVCFEQLEGACPFVRSPVADDALEMCAPGQCRTDVCGPDPAREPFLCCYWAITTECLNPGRPFVVRGVDRLADVRTRDDWRDAIDVESVSPAMRAALARAWTEDARCEHAAVASFARFAIQLLAVGAPADLVARAQRAGADELRHARAFFGLASAYGGRSVGPGPLDTSDALADGCGLEHVVVATVREGCIAETISLVQLATAHGNARDPALRSLLATIVEEELEHVELAWSFVAWALARGDARLRSAVAQAFATADTAIPRAPSTFEPGPDDVATWSAAARLRADERTALARVTLRELVGPCARRLLGPSDLPQDARA
jgi:hypothetical protein